MFQQVDEQAVGKPLLAELETSLSSASGMAFQLRLLPPVIALADHPAEKN